jgi:hypothetical protein
MINNNINYKFLLVNQLSYLTNIIFVITLYLIFTNNSSNILPLNIIVLIGIIVLFHIYPNYYKLVYYKNRKFIPLVIIKDFITHYLPIIIILISGNYYSTKTNYKLCFFIIFSYLIIFRNDIDDIYFKPRKFFE